MPGYFWLASDVNPIEIVQLKRNQESAEHNEFRAEDPLSAG